MLKYLLKVTVHHPGRYLSDKLVSKFNLKVEFDEERVKKDEDPIFEVTSSAEAMTIPLAYIALNVKSYEIEWIDKSEYCENWLTISHLDLGEKGLKLEMITMDTETSVFVGLPVPIVWFILSGGYYFYYDRCSVLEYLFYTFVFYWYY